MGNKRRKGILKQCMQGVALILSATSLLLAAGCGKPAGGLQETESADLQSEHFYKTEKKIVQLYGSEMVFAEHMTEKQLDILIYRNEESAIRQVDFNTLAETEVMLQTAPGFSAYNFDVSGEGYLCLLSSDSGEAALAMFDSKGNCIRQEDVTDQLEGSPLELSALHEDEDGKIYLTLGNILYQWDKDFVFMGKLPMSGEGRGFLTDAQGNLLVGCCEQTPQGEELIKLSELDRKQLKWKKNIVQTPGSFYLANEGTDRVYTFDGAGFGEWKTKGGNPTMLGQWKDVNVQGLNVVDLYCSEQVKTALVYDYEGKKLQIVSLTEVDREELPEKTEIVLAAKADVSHRLENDVIAFNEQSDSVKVTLKKYYEDETVMNDAAYQDAVNRFDVDLINGGTEADVFWLQDNYIDRLMRYGVLEDLTPYLAKSKTLSLNDFWPGVVSAYTYDGKLAGIPSYGFLSTIFGRKSVLGENGQWTIGEMAAYAKEYPGVPVVAWMDAQGLLSQFLLNGGGQFVDWKQGSVCFDSEAFRKSLEFLKEQQSIEVNYEHSLGWLISQREALTAYTYLTDFTSLQEYRAMFEEDLAAVGYPTKEGESGTYLMCSGMYAMNSASEQKEAAWEFLEYMYSMEPQGGFPTNKQLWERTARRAIGNADIFEDGVTVRDYGDWSYPLRTVDEQDIAFVRNLMEQGKVMFMDDKRGYELANIALEEAAPYFAGQKTVDEVCEIIQSRAAIYVNENR